MSTLKSTDPFPQNPTAEELEGITRCGCGAKYWDTVDGVITCHSCGDPYRGGRCPECGQSGHYGGESRCRGCDFQLQWDLFKMFTPGANPVSAYDDGKVKG